MALEEIYVGSRAEAFKIRRRKIRDGAYFATVRDLFTGEEFGEGMKPYEILTVTTASGSQLVLDQSTMEWRYILVAGKKPPIMQGRMLTLPPVQIGEPVIILIPKENEEVNEVRTDEVIKLRREYKHREVRSANSSSRMHSSRQTSQMERMSIPKVLPPNSSETPA